MSRKLEKDSNSNFKTNEPFIFNSLYNKGDGKIPTESFEFQVAGHKDQGDRNIIRDELGHVLKLVQKPPKGQREVNFYKRIFEENKYERIRPFFPKFHGVVVHDGAEFLVLDDIVQGFKLPCVLDIKIGCQTWDPEASLEKQNHEDSKYPGTKKPLGLALLGMIFTNLSTGQVERREREFGKSLNVQTFPQGLQDFFNGAKHSGNLARKFCPRLKEIREFIKGQQEFGFFASSILFAYDASQLNEEDSESRKDFVRAWMIDFAHVFPLQSPYDLNYLFGLENLIRTLEDLGSFK